MNTPLPLLLVLGAAVILIVKMSRSLVSTAIDAGMDWKDIVAKLQPVNLQGRGLVGRDYLEPSRDQLKLDPNEIWSLVGGWEGLKKMRANAEVMLALAAYTQRWNFEEGVVVAERMRRDALTLRRAAHHVELQMKPYLMRFLPKRYWFNVPFEVHEVASAYYLMRQRLLALYETSHSGLYPRLAASL